MTWPAATCPSKMAVSAASSAPLTSCADSSPDAFPLRPWPCFSEARSGESADSPFGLFWKECISRPCRNREVTHPPSQPKSPARVALSVTQPPARHRSTSIPSDVAASLGKRTPRERSSGEPNSGGEATTAPRLERRGYFYSPQAIPLRCRRFPREADSGGADSGKRTPSQRQPRVHKPRGRAVLFVYFVCFVGRIPRLSDPRPALPYTALSYLS